MKIGINRYLLIHYTVGAIKTSERGRYRHSFLKLDVKGSNNILIKWVYTLIFFKYSLKETMAFVYCISHAYSVFYIILRCDVKFINNRVPSDSSLTIDFLWAR